MTDESENDAIEQKVTRKRTEMIGVGIAFLPIAVALFLTMDSVAIALPFLVLSLVFIMIGMQKKPPRGERGTQ